MKLSHRQDFTRLSSPVVLRAFVVSFAIASSFLAVPSSGSAEPSDLSVKVLGKTVTLKTVDDRPRSSPHQTIIVCSDNSDVDIARLKLVAQEFFPSEKYLILDGKLHLSNSMWKGATLVFFGRGDSQEVASTCVKSVPGFAKYIRLQAIQVQNQMGKLSKKLNAQFGRDGVLTGSYCGTHGPNAEIDGKAVGWSVQLRSPKSETCLRSYWAVFGIDRLCLTDRCDEAEGQSIMAETLGVK